MSAINSTSQFQITGQSNVVALCAGCGGLELGIQLALGMRGQQARGICYVEREAAAAASLVASMEAGWFHQAPVWSDLLTFDARPWRGLVHILASGDPCQDNSVAGRGAGAGGKRFLAPEVIRIAEECGPDRIFRENVPGNSDGQLEAIVPALERLGYCVAVGIFSSSETRNTMRRERMFIMADRACERCGETRERCGGCAQRACERSGTLGCPESGSGGGKQQSRSAGRWRSGFTGTGTGMACAECPEWRPDSAPCKDHGSNRDEWRQEGADWLEASSQHMGSAAHGRRREGRTELAGWQREPSPCVTGGADERFPDLASASASVSRPQRQQRVKRIEAGRKEPFGHAGLRGRTILPPAVIPGPSDTAGWLDVLDRFPEFQPALSQEEAESHLRRGFDAMAHRVERLRATGNGVDPLAAAYAYLSLDALLAADRSARKSVLKGLAA